MSDLRFPNTDPTLAIFHQTDAEIERRVMVYFQQTLTADGEARTVRVEREGLHEDAPLQVEPIKGDDHAA